LARCRALDWKKENAPDLREQPGAGTTLVRSVVMGEPTAARLLARPAAGSDYPADLLEFQAWFASDEACVAYLEW
jgi:hypothetical protein